MQAYHDQNLNFERFLYCLRLHTLPRSQALFSGRVHYNKQCFLIKIIIMLRTIS